MACWTTLLLRRNFLFRNLRYKLLSSNRFWQPTLLIAADDEKYFILELGELEKPFEFSSALFECIRMDVVSSLHSWETFSWFSPSQWLVACTCSSNHLRTKSVGGRNFRKMSWDSMSCKVEKKDAFRYMWRLIIHSFRNIFFFFQKWIWNRYIY